ncbi:uncharacterized protein LOC121378127 isoform X2 [Gigantopelta aegis]|uniref:uncharacterized protein LOC121378127 isoform X2 n=1 Tax=Gigantopelta aegis TaxID=1735272 RepID=UPI001B88836C|nr:uncharacterized protein LOC121378127 isoform X2 [Gigantopelta aegis]
MSEYSVISDPEALIECPYDKVHMIRAKRFPYHLLKCKKNYVGSEFSVCPFNARHEMPKPELRYHMANCPDRARLEKDLAYESSLKSEDGSLFKGCTDVPAYKSSVDMNENWDHELPMSVRIGVHPSFFEKCQYKNLTGFTPAQKRAFYENLKEGHDGLVPRTQTEMSSAMDVASRLRVPHKASEALKLMPTVPTVTPKPPNNVFMYSLSMAGVGRGRGVLVNVDKGPTLGISTGVGRGSLLIYLLVFSVSEYGQRTDTGHLHRGREGIITHIFVSFQC